MASCLPDMALNKLRQLDQNTYGVTIPKNDLHLEGLLDEDGELVDEQHLHIQRTDDSEWALKRVEQVDILQPTYTSLIN